MPEINKYQSKKDVNKIKTTVTLKMGTKNMLSDIAKKGESFDDIINRLIRTNEINEMKIRRYQNLLEKNKLYIKNKISIGDYQRGINSIRLDERTVIKFSYNKPEKISSDQYSFDIVIEDIISKNENKDVLISSKDMKAIIYFRMIEKIINLHFDPSYSIPGNKNLLDIHYWKKVWRRIGLKNDSFDQDISKFIHGIMEESNE